MVGLNETNVLKLADLCVILGLGICVLVPDFPRWISLDASKAEGSEDTDVVFVLPRWTGKGIKEVVTNSLHMEDIHVLGCLSSSGAVGSNCVRCKSSGSIDDLSL